MPLKGYKAHESLHRSGGKDAIAGALALAAMANLTTGKMWQGVAGRPSEVDPPAGGGINATTGTYTGDGTTNRAIAHGLGVVPKIVIIWNLTGEQLHLIMSNYVYYDSLGWCAYLSATSDGVFGMTVSNTTNFYVTGNTTNYSNQTDSVYYWVAIG